MAIKGYFYYFLCCVLCPYFDLVFRWIASASLSQKITTGKDGRALHLSPEALILKSKKIWRRIQRRLPIILRQTLSELQKQYWQVKKQPGTWVYRWAICTSWRWLVKSHITKAQPVKCVILTVPNLNNGYRVTGYLPTMRSGKKRKNIAWKGV